MYFLINWLNSECLLLLVIPIRTNLTHLNFAPWRAIIANECLKPWRGLRLVRCVGHLILEFNFLRNLRNTDIFGTLQGWLVLRVPLKRLFDDYVNFLVSQLVRIKANFSQWFTILWLLSLLRLNSNLSCMSNIRSLLDEIRVVSHILVLITTILCKQLHRWFCCCSVFLLLFFSLLFF